MELNRALIQILMGMIGTLGFTFLYNIRGKKLLLAVLGAGLSWSFNLILTDSIPSEPMRYFLCAALVALYGEILARKLKTPATTFFIPTLIPHIPGGALYTTMRLALDKQWVACMEQAFYTFRLALALAMGLITVLSVFNAHGVLQRYLASRNKEESTR